LNRPPASAAGGASNNTARALAVISRICILKGPERLWPEDGLLSFYQDP